MIDTAAERAWLRSDVPNIAAAMRAAKYLDEIDRLNVELADLRQAHTNVLEQLVPGRLRWDADGQRWLPEP